MRTIQLNRSRAVSATALAGGKESLDPAERKRSTFALNARALATQGKLPSGTANKLYGVKKP